MSDISTCGIVCPTDWVPLPLEPTDDVRSWAKETATLLWERGKAAGHELDKRVLRKNLRARADDSRGRDPFYAFAYYPDGFDTALALLEVDLIHPDTTVPELSLDWLTDTFSAHDFGAPDVRRVDLPAGPAVRIRQNFAADDRPPGGPGILMETLTYGIRPTGAEAAVMLLGSWTIPGIAEEIEEAIDSMAQTVTVEF
ncbi:hypothetical protein [Streptomyces sp. NPDC000134]|uniref:hypothetical protein n=1 Tax=Streptomyces sp. NPDC000134 TaxID=3364536 RepID=UPI00368CA6B0